MNEEPQFKVLLFAELVHQVLLDHWMELPRDLRRQVKDMAAELLYGTEEPS